MLAKKSENKKNNSPGMIPSNLFFFFIKYNELTIILKFALYSYKPWSNIFHLSGSIVNNRHFTSPFYIKKGVNKPKKQLTQVLKAGFMSISRIPPINRNQYSGSPLLKKPKAQSTARELMATINQDVEKLPLI